MRERAAITQNKSLTRYVNERNEITINDKTLTDTDETPISCLGHARDALFNLTYLKCKHMLNSISGYD